MKMKQLTTVVALSVAVFSSAAQTPDDSVYQAFGGQAGITRLMDDFVGRLVVDPRIGSFFKDTKLSRLKEKLAEQLCVAGGGPCTYTGDSMVESHRGQGVGKADFNALVEVLQDSMNAAGIPFSAQNQMLARLAPTHRDIIEK